MNSDMIKKIVSNNSNNISILITVICIIVIIMTTHQFIKNRKFNRLPNYLISVMSYATTTFAAVIALIYLDK